MKRIGIDLANKDLENWRERREMLCKTSSSTPETTLGKFLDNQRYERDEEHNEDRNYTTFNPIQDWLQVGAVSWLHWISDRDILVVEAHDGFMLQCSKIDHNNHEELN